MVAPGHCSPSRNVVSKITTRSFSDFCGSDLGGPDAVAAGLISVVMVRGPYRLRLPRGSWREISKNLSGCCLEILPLSAQAQTPSRPSGGNKEQQPAKKLRVQLKIHEGSIGRGQNGLPGHRAEIAARRHCLSPRCGPKVAD